MAVLAQMLVVLAGIIVGAAGDPTDENMYLCFVAVYSGWGCCCRGRIDICIKSVLWEGGEPRNMEGWVVNPTHSRYTFRLISCNNLTPIVVVVVAALSSTFCVFLLSALLPCPCPCPLPTWAATRCLVASVASSTSPPINCGPFPSS